MAKDALPNGTHAPYAGAAPPSVDAPPPIAWTIAGSDSGGAAGIQADLPTFAHFGVHGCTVLSCVTAQDSQGPASLHQVPVAMLEDQLRTLHRDLPPRAIKIGLIPGAAAIRALGRWLEKQHCFVVYDPVLSSSSGVPFLDDAARRAAIGHLLPRVDLLSPNRLEAQLLLGRPLPDAASLESAAAELLHTGAASVLITGGHAPHPEERGWDYWCDKHGGFWMRGANLPQEARGTGCVLSAAIAACIAKGETLPDALVLAKAYLSRGLRRSRAIGSGPGPVRHGKEPVALEDFPAVQLGAPPARTPMPPFPRCQTRRLGLYPVVDSVAWMEKLLPLGIGAIQLRIKNRPPAYVEKAVKAACTLAQRHGVQLFINDHWRAALRAGAYGVHLGQEDLHGADLPALAQAGLRLGVSTHGWWEIARSYPLHPSYIAVGPIYPTTSKKMSCPPQGIARLRDMRRLLQSFPVVAIGGIDAARIPEVQKCGVDGVAMIRAVTEAPDYRAKLKRLLAALQDAGGV